MDLKSIMPTEIRQRKDKYRMSSLMCEIFRKMATIATKKLIEAESRLVDARVRDLGKWAKLVKRSKGTNFQILISHENIMYSLVTIVNKTILHI